MALPDIEEITKITNGISKSQTVLQPGQYYQVPFSFFCGFAGFRVYASNYEQNKIYAIMISNKYASKIEEINSYLFANNSNVSTTFEIIDGANDDWNKYIRVSNTGSEEVVLCYGVQNMI